MRKSKKKKHSFCDEPSEFTSEQDRLLRSHDAAYKLDETNVTYCHTCDKFIQSMGIASHRAAHRRRNENCKITYSSGRTVSHAYGDKKKRND